MSLSKHGLFLLFVIFLLNSCSLKKETVALEEYPDFAEKEIAVIPICGRDKSDVTILKNTSTFHTVEIKQMKFEPTELKLHKGDTVLWINKDITDHDVTEETKNAWTSSKLTMGKSWSMVVKESVDYFCSIHLVMKGKLIVEQATL